MTLAIMGYDHAEQKEIEPAAESSSSTNVVDSSTEAPIDSEKQAWADNIGGALTRSQSSYDEGGDRGKRHQTLGKLRLRAADDDLPTSWWFASTAVPLIAATFAPMANLLSIAALVVYWRNDVIEFEDPVTRESTSKGYRDPDWCTYILGQRLQALTVARF